MKDVFSSLIKLADNLDSRGHHDLANEIDKIIVKMAEEKLDDVQHMNKFKNLGEVSVEIPKEEYENLKNTFKNLSKSLRDDEVSDSEEDFQEKE